MKYREYELENEIERLGCGFDDLGPVDSICVQEEEGTWRFYDDHVSREFQDSEIFRILQKLKALPDMAGWDAFWQAIN